MVGPYVFLDQMGPVTFAPGKGIDVRPHPHIGLATLTYLFDGTILHRDSLGTVARIVPGEVNWMIAGRGIAHSERTPPDVRANGGRTYGFQIWIALPKKDEETAPAFTHFNRDELPVIEDGGMCARLIAGSMFGARSPVKTFSEMFYADVSLEAGTELRLRDEHEERAAYLTAGRLEFGGQVLNPGDMPVFRRRGEVVLRAVTDTRLLLLGGEPMDGPRHIFWNFVSSSNERIEQAKADWRNKRFQPVPDETEFIPLPDEPAPPVRYP